MGAWLASYGEAIYDTRPWYTFGEGPTKEPEGHFDNHREFMKIRYSWKDVRYSTKGSTIYASMLGWPGAGEEVLLTAFASDSLPESLELVSLRLMGCDEEIRWELTEAGLALTMPTDAPDEMAIVCKIETR